MKHQNILGLTVLTVLFSVGTLAANAQKAPVPPTAAGPTVADAP